MNRREGKIWIWIVVGIIVVLIIGTVAGFIALKYAKRRTKDLLEKKFAEAIAPAEKKFIEMLPKDYDREYARKTFNSFIEASKSGRLRVKKVIEDFAPYLQQAVEDGKLSHQEADSVLKLMRNVIIK